MKKKLSHLFFTVFIAGTGLMAAASAQAACGLHGKIARITQNGTSMSVFLVPYTTLFPLYSYIFSTSDYKMMSSLTDAFTANTSVYITNDSAASCPATPSAGMNIVVGTITSIALFRNQ